MKVGFLWVLGCLSLPISHFAQSSPQQFAKNEVLADLDYLYENVPRAHYNLYAYVPKARFDSAYLAIKRSITADSLSLLQATNALQRLISTANIGHTSIEFPIAAYAQHVYSGGTVFPLELAFEDGKSLIRKNWSAQEDIPLGAEVVSINGEPLDTIISRLNPQLSAERPYFKRAKMELYSFPRLYWQVYGPQDTFTVVVRSQNNETSYVLPAVPGLDGYEMKRSEVINASLNVQFIGSAAFLNPGSFGGDLTAYQHFIDSAFAEILQEGSQQLIIDLRNNGGGDDAFSDYLVSYIADRPFRWASHFSLKSSRLLKQHVRQNNDTTEAYFRSILDHPDGEHYPYDLGEYQPQPAEKRFRGEVYVLINRQSHSQAAVTAAQIQDYEFGTLVGEETGEYPTLYASIFQFALPHTGISVNVSKGYMVRINGSEQQTGVTPDVRIRDHLLDEEDEILDALLERLH